MVRMVGTKNRIAAALGWILATIAIFWLTLLLSFEFFAKWRQVDVFNSHPRDFPVVMLKSTGPEITLVSDFDVSAHNGTFLIPAPSVGSIAEQLRKRQAERGAGYPEVKVEQLSENHQLISLEIYGDGIFRSSYEVDTRSIKPRTRTMAGSLFIYYPTGVAMLVTVALIALSRFAVGRWKLR